MARHRRYTRKDPKILTKPDEKPVSKLAQEVLAQAEREDRAAERMQSRDNGPKPRAIRRYEKYANMG